MKRSALKRKPRAPRQPRKPRKPLKKKGARAKRDESALRLFRETVVARAAGTCELCKHTPQGAPPRIEAHHLVGRGRAAGWFRLHDAAINGLGICRACHNDCTLDPRLAGRAFFRAMAIWKQDRKTG